MKHCSSQNYLRLHGLHDSKSKTYLVTSLFSNYGAGYKRLPFWWTGVGVPAAVVNAGQEAGGGTREPAALPTEQTYEIGSKRLDLLSLG